MSKIDQNDIFGTVKMGYIIIESNELTDWRRFGEAALGLHVESHNSEFVAFRLDAHRRRIIITKGPKEDVVAIGWQVNDEQSLDIILNRLKQRNIDVSEGDPQDTQLRSIKSFYTVNGPKNIPIELFVEADIDSKSLSMLSSGFKTDVCGMGHVAMSSRQPKKVLQFWQDIFDARLSDYIEQAASGLTLDITFLRLNPRHHSIAVVGTRGISLDPIRTKIHHFNIEVASLEDLTAAYQRCKKLGYKMAHGIGQHPNDKELSFYVITPSGFEMEFGWAPIWVDESDWQPVTHKAISIWGHHLEDVSPLSRFKELKQGVKSLLTPEFTPL